MTDEARLFFEVLQADYQGLLELEFRTAAAVMLSLGWIVSSTTVQGLFRSSRWLPVGTTVGVTGVAFVYVHWVLEVYVHSQALVARLEAEGFPPEALAAREVTRTLATSVCTVQLILFASVVALGWWLHAGGRPGRNDADPA